MKTCSINLLVCLLFFTINAHALNLNEALEKALNNNFNLKALNEDVENKKMNLKATKNLNLPILFFKGSYTLQESAKYTNISTPAPFPDMEYKSVNKNFYDVFAGIRYNIYSGGVISSKIKIDEYDFKSAKFDFIEETNKLKFQIKRTYANILQVKAYTNVAKFQVKTIKSHLEDVKKFYEKGLVANIDLMQTRIKLREAEQNLIDIKKQLNILKANLSVLTGDLPVSDYNVDELDFDFSNIPIIELLLDKAKSNRALLKKLDQKANAAKEFENISKAGYKPKFFIQGGYKYSDNINDLTPEGGFAVEAGVDFTLDWTRPFDEAKARKHMTYKIQNLKRNVELKILMQVKSAYENYKAAVSNHKVAQSSLEEAEEFFRITKLKYSNGLASNTDVLDAETMLTNAKSNEKKAYYEILKAYFSIENAIGCEIGETYE